MSRSLSGVHLAPSEFVTLRAPPPGAAVSRIQIELLGKPRVLVDSTDVTARIKYHKGIGLLAFLSVECNVLHPREQLADMFWPELSARAARTNLRQVLCNLSSALALTESANCAVLRVTDDDIGLFPDPSVGIDVVRVRGQIAIQRNRHWRMLGSPTLTDAMPAQLAFDVPVRQLLAGFDLPDCGAYMAWLEEQRLLFADYAVAIYEDLATRLVIAGNTALAIDCAYQIEQIDPLLERNQVRLMQLLISSGQPRRALRQYERFARRLRNELDVEPAPPTTLLYGRLKHEQCELAWPGVVPLNALDSAGESAQPYSVSVLCAAFDAAAGGDGERTLAQRARVALIDLLRSHGGTVMQHTGLSICAWFVGSNGDSCSCHTAQVAARAAMVGIQVDGHLRIGIYTDAAAVRTGWQSDEVLAEASELATRLSLIAEDGDIVTSTSTRGGQAQDAKALGEWKFRGLSKSVTVFRLARTATA